MGEFERDYAFCADMKPVDYVNPPATFQGIVRADGRVATRNYIGILTSVNCSATVARMVADHFRNNLADYPNVDGVVALTHKTGCGMASEGEGMELLRRILDVADPDPTGPTDQTVPVASTAATGADSSPAGPAVVAATPRKSTRSPARNPATGAAPASSAAPTTTITAGIVSPSAANRSVFNTVPCGIGPRAALPKI
jgi:hypothetical protein